MKMKSRKATSHPYYLRSQKHRAAGTEDRSSDSPEPIHILSDLPVKADQQSDDKSIDLGGADIQTMKMKRRKTTTHPKHRVDREDRISDLPEPIIGHILSNLPFKNAVATGILSKRWRFLWTTTGNLDFSFEGGCVEQFVKSVNYVMHLHNPAACFNKLCLTWKAECIPLHFNTWICTAVARNVRELSVDANFMYELPLDVKSCLFSHSKLKSLELYCKEICISPEMVVSLPRLETLKLTVSFPSEDAFCKLLDGCPVLKRLDIRIHCHITVAFKCIISSTTLKHLQLYVSAGAPCSVVLDAPSLEYIWLLDINSIVLQQRLNCLSRAFICPASVRQQIRDPNYCNSFVEALCALSCVDTLSVSSQVTEALGCATIKMETEFNRLTSLTVDGGINCLTAIQNLIELSGNLKLLIVYMDSDDNNNGEGQFNDLNWTKPDIVPGCLSNSLIMVSFRGFDGHPDVLAMIEYFIKHGSVLRLMQINFSTTFSRLNEKDELVRLISTFPKKSTVCKVKCC